MNKLLLAILLSLLSTPLVGQLVFEHETVEIKATPGEAKVTASFPFANTGAYPVTILETRSSCGCTTAKLDKRRYEPGEAGQIEAVFDIGQRMGAQKKHITVRADDPAHENYTLTLSVDIPEILRLSARGLIWQQGGAAETKTVQLEVVYPEPVHIQKVITLGSNFTAELKTIEEGRRYEVAITPTSTGQVDNRMVQVVTDFPTTSPKTYFINVRVHKTTPPHAATPPTPPS